MAAEQQMLLWVEWELNKALPTGGRFKEASLAVKPRLIWTLLRGTDKAKPPSLPITPEHGVNAFMEDEIHDWRWQGGKLRFYSRVVGRSVWLLLEYGKGVACTGSSAKT